MTNLPNSTGSGDLDNLAVTRAEFRAEIGLLLEYLAQALGDVGGDYTNEVVNPTEVTLQGKPMIDIGSNPSGSSVNQRIPSTKWVKENGTYVSNSAYGAPKDGQLWVDTSTNSYALKAYNSGESDWDLVSGFASGTRMLFQQKFAPTGWTKVTSGIDNHALRVTTGTPTVVSNQQSFSSVFTTVPIDGTVADTTLTENQMPQHKHGVTDAGHDHGSTATGVDNHTHEVGTLPAYYGADGQNRPPGWSSGDRQQGSSKTTTSAASGNVSVTIPAGTTGLQVQNTGASEAHTHSFDGTNINLSINYVDVIVAQKD